MSKTKSYLIRINESCKTRLDKYNSDKHNSKLSYNQLIISILSDARLVNEYDKLLEHLYKEINKTRLNRLTYRYQE